jgi:putative endonuclease
MPSSKTWFVYLIECTDGCLYTGIAVDPVARFEAHRQGRGARYMRLHPPLRLLATEAHADRSAASKAEYRIKQLSPAAKRAYAVGMTAAPRVSTS